MTFQVPQPSGDLQSWAMTLSAELQREINQIEFARLEEQERHRKAEKLQADRITELEQALSQAVDELEQSLATILTRLEGQDAALADLDARITQLENA